jgi:PAS domain S-box-containing protein
MTSNGDKESARWETPAAVGAGGGVPPLPGATAPDATWQRRYERVAALSRQVAYEYCPGSNRIVWGSSLEQVLGYGLQGIAGTIEEWTEWIHPEDRAEATRLLAHAEATGTDYDCEYRARHRLGHYVWFRDRGYFVPETSVPGGSLMVGVMQDVSDRRQADEALRESEARYRGVVENTLVGIGISAQDRFVYANQTLLRLADCGSLEELAAKPLTEYLTPSSRAYLAYYVEARNGGNAVPLELELEAIRPDGVQRALRVCTSPVRLDGLMYELSTVIDVTDQRRAERERLDIQRRLLDAQKLESLGVLAGGIAHDFNNLLMAVLGNLDMALADTPEGSPAGASIRQAMQASRRATDLTRGMLAYSGRGHFAPRPVDLNELVRENAELLRTSVARTTSLSVCLAQQQVYIEADPGQVQQVVMNLITNASEAIGDGPGVVTLRTALLGQTAEELEWSRLEEKPESGQFACLEVVDTGCGMDDEVQARLFDPFYTTKAAGRGLGMSAVLGIVRGHRGAIFITSAPGRGTTVRVLFPACVAPEATDSPTAAAPPRPSPFAGTVLVVDDDDDVRHLCVAYLHRLGAKPVGAADGEQAVMLFRKWGAEIRLVLLDLTMPRKDGLATYRELKRLRADVPVILCSGYCEQDATRRFAGEGLACFLQKPFELRQLREAIERVLRPP